MRPGAVKGDFKVFLAFSARIPVYGAINGGVDPMRYVIAALAFAAAVLGGSISALAEKRIFIIANNSDGYGIDRCLASGANCGVAVATAYCKSRDFSQAASFRKVDHDEITGAVPSTNGSSVRDEFVAIECLR